MMRMKTLAKTLWHIAAFVGVAAVSVFDDGKVSGVAEWCLLATALANAAVVYVVPEMKSGVAKHAKAVVAIVVAAAGVIPTLAVDGLNSQDAWQIVLVSLAALGTPLIVNGGYVRARKVVGAREATERML